MLFQIYVSHIVKNQQGGGEYASAPTALPPIEADSAEAIKKWLEPLKSQSLDNQYPFPPCPPRCTHRHKFTVLPMETFKIPE